MVSGSPRHDGLSGCRCRHVTPEVEAVSTESAAAGGQAAAEEVIRQTVSSADCLGLRKQRKIDMRFGVVNVRSSCRSGSFKTGVRQ